MASFYPLIATSCLFFLLPFAHSLQRFRFSESRARLDRDKTPPPYPIINIHLDEGKLPDGPETDMSMFLQQERNRQREVEDSMHKKREFFQSLMGDQQQEVEFLTDLEQTLGERPSSSEYE